jgi:effector-binding domain-containing protein
MELCNHDEFETTVKVAAPLLAMAGGPYEGLPSAWSEFNKWMKADGHEQAENLWEVYLVGPQSSPDAANWRTELNRPLAN